MKRIGILIAFMSGLFFSACNKNKTEKSSELPGDNLDLYAVLNIFKTSKTPEAFEKSLNDKSNKVNNLDLNGDGKVDYIKVVDNKDGDDHAITLRVPISKTESQDVAVIEIEKTGDKKANIQIVGDEEIYGKDFVIEPKDENGQAGFVFTTVAVNVWYWPCVTYVYSPAYVVYASPWDYDYYPIWWDPWEPVAYEVYYPIVVPYHSYYYPVGHPRFERANEIYVEHRMTSGYVERQRFNNNGYRNNGRNNIAPRNGGQNQMPPQRGNQNNYSPGARQNNGNNGGKNIPRAGRMPQPGPSHQNQNGNNPGMRKSNEPGQQNIPQQRNQNMPRPNSNVERNSNRGQNQNTGRNPAPQNRMPQNNVPHERPMPQGGMPHQGPQGGMPHGNMPHPQGGRPR